MTSKIPRSKTTKSKRKESINSLQLGVTLSKAGIHQNAVNGNEADVDGWIEILSLEDESSTNLCLDYQLKSLTPNKKGISIPKKMLHKGLEGLLPLVVFAVDEEGAIYYSYLPKKFCKYHLDSGTTKTVTISIGGIFKRTEDEEKIKEFRKELIRMCEFHKNKFNDNAIFELLKEYERGWLNGGLDIILERLNTLEKFSFFRTDEGDYPVQQFIFKKVPELFDLDFSDFSAVFIEKIVSLVTNYKYDDPETVLLLLNQLYLRSGLALEIKTKTKIKKKILEFSKHDYQLLRLTNLTAFTKLVSLLEDEATTTDLDLTCETCSNLLELDYGGMVATENENSFTLHRGVILYSDEFKNSRLRILNKLFDIYKKTTKVEEKIKIIKTINQSLHPYTNPTSPENIKKLEAMLSKERGIITTFYIENVLNEDSAKNYVMFSEIEKGVVFSKSKKLTDAIKLLSNKAKFYNLLMVDMWRYRDYSLKIQDVSKLWLEEFTALSKTLENKDIISVLKIISEEHSLLGSEFPFQQVTLGARYLGENNLSSEKAVSDLAMASILCPLLAGIFRNNNKFFNDLTSKDKNHISYAKLGAFKVLTISKEEEITDTVNALDISGISTLNQSVFLASFEGLLTSAKFIKKETFRKLFLAFISDREELDDAKVSLIEHSFIRGEINLDYFNAKEIRVMLNLYKKLFSITNLTYGGFIKDLSRKNTALFIELLKKRLEYKPSKNSRFYYEAIPDNIDFLDEDKSFAEKEIFELVKDKIEKSKSSLEIYGLKNLFKYINSSEVDSYILTNLVKNEAVVRKFLNYGLGSDDVLIKILNKGKKYFPLVIPRLQQWYPAVGFYNQEESVLITRHIERLEHIKGAVKNINAKKLIEELIKNLKTE